MPKRALLELVSLMMVSSLRVVVMLAPMEEGPTLLPLRVMPALLKASMGPLVRSLLVMVVTALAPDGKLLESWEAHLLVRVLLLTVCMMRRISFARWEALVALGGCVSEQIGWMIERAVALGRRVMIWELTTTMVNEKCC
jgi:hypothetical protein